MKSNTKKTRILISVFLAFIYSNSSVAQQFNLNNQESTLNVLGTSSLHDWEITTESQDGKKVYGYNNC